MAEISQDPLSTKSHTYLDMTSYDYDFVISSVVSYLAASSALHTGLTVGTTSV